MCLIGQSIRDTLKHLFHFRLLEDDQLDALAIISSRRTYQAGELIFSQGEEATAFYIVLSGKVQIYKISTEGKEMILHLFGVGEAFAEVPIFSGIPKYPANSLCMENSEILVIQGDGFRALVRQYPDIALNILSELARRLHEFSDLIEDLSLRTVDSRLARYLLSVSENSQDKAVSYIQKKTLAAILGTVPETLSRAFKKLSEKGIIEVEGNHIHLLDRDTLDKMAR
ncbi:MAG: Crp/Fnr family transcriptional regulator [Cyanobacteria bacterium HKST-UBA03]|nr:Crp/Fnr family transcriptional regulator [Cyanobacteria bacterium HKST-UBA03]